VLSVAGAVVAIAAKLSQQHSLLTNDADILALVEHHSFTHRASHESVNGCGFSGAGLPTVTRPVMLDVHE
jgi:hypothetical protein